MGELRAACGSYELRVGVTSFVCASYVIRVRVTSFVWELRASCGSYSLLRYVPIQLVK